MGLVRVSLQGEEGSLWRDEIKVQNVAWETTRLLVDVPQEENLELEVMIKLLSGETLAIDSVHIETIGPVGEGDSPPQKLTPGSEARLAALARLYGYTRWFHPADQVLEADWDTIAVEGVKLAEATTNVDELAAGLEALLQPAAPTLQVWPESHTPPPLYHNHKRAIETSRGTT